MRETADAPHYAAHEWEEQYPALRGLGLHIEELKQLQGQGGLETYNRRGNRYFRLRFRKGQKRRSLYLGSNSNTVHAIQEELHRLQSPRSALRALKAEQIRARQKLKSVRRQSAAALQALGYHFHGVEVRKFRR